MTSRCPIPAVIVVELCRLLTLDIEPIVSLRKRVPGSDWPDIVAASESVRS
jgi:hypothetical protein